MSIIPKSIKIFYSDNPIHEAIHRIIDSCNRIDEDDDYCHMATLGLEDAAQDLLILANARIEDIKRQYQKEMYGEKLY